MEHGLSAKAINERLAAGSVHTYLRDWIYGGIDGAVTIFAVVSGVAGAQLSIVSHAKGFVEVVRCAKRATPSAEKASRSHGD